LHWQTATFHATRSNAALQTKQQRLWLVLGMAHALQNGAIFAVALWKGNLRPSLAT
jgi:hypothetical protein